MTTDQAIAFALIGCTVAMFVWGRVAYELVALTALLIGTLAGVIPANRAFAGFSEDIVIIVAAALVVSAAIGRSGVIETLMRPILPKLRTLNTQVPVLVGATMLLSMVTKNVGALAILMPVALQLARRTKTSASAMLMPMAFASLLGGTVTLIGTAPNIIIAKIRHDVTGHAFGMFDFSPVGLGISALGFVFLCFGWRLLPRDRHAAASMEDAFSLEAYVAEARIGPGSPAAGRTVAELEAMGGGEVTVAGIVRERFRRYLPTPAAVLREGDIVLLQGDPADLERLVARARLHLSTGQTEDAGHEVSVVEGVLTAGSPVIGKTETTAGLRDVHGMTLLAVSRSGQRIGQLLNTVRLRAGDVLVLKGRSASVPETLGALRILPLAARSLTLGRSQRSFVPLIVLAVAMVLVAMHLVPVAVAFAGAAVVLLLLRVMTMHEAYDTIEWHVIFLLAALIPLGGAVQRTGGTNLIAGLLSRVVHLVPPLGALGIVLTLVLLVTPFLHNAPTTLIMGPIAAALAKQMGLNPDPFLMAVALGAGCDFLSPIGHQCNTLVMGPGGYRFADYWKLGLPLTLAVIACGTPLIAWVWPLHAR